MHKKSSLKRLKDMFFPILILIITSFVAFKNYTPNTYLTGWDNLHPEFNFKLNIQRSLHVVWQEYQGLGLLGGMAHAADLPRQIFLYGVSVFLPINLIRYFWTFLMLFIGPLGVYFLVGRFVLGSEPRTKNIRFGTLPAICASIFYLFNLATVQYFFVPFETFTSFFGFLPWLIYFAYKYLKGDGNLKSYVFISLLAVPAFYVQTLFVVYVMLLLCLVIINYKQSLLLRSRKSIWLFLTTFLINSFWLLPVIYFTLVNGSVPTNSKINSIATPETYYMNQARSDFKSIATFKGYWFDYYDWNEESQKFDYLYKNWESYSSRVSVQYIGIGLFITSILGLLLSRQISFILMFIVSVIMISGVKIPVSVLSEAFRNSFTKWSAALSFMTSLGLGFFVSKFKRVILFLTSFVIIGLSIYQVIPIFNGNLISTSMRINIPNEYFDSFNFLNTRTNGGRVAVLPVNNFWGWQFHSWGYRGSGFYWYAVKNPILDRAFDVWSKHNENFYEELNYGLQINNYELLKDIFEKYQVSYIYNDKNIFTPQNDVKFEPDLSKFTLIASFGNIDIYETGYFGEPVLVPTKKYSENLLKVATKLDFIDLVNEPTIVENFGKDQGYENIENCDLFKKGNVERQKRDDGNLYIANNGGVACDYFYYSQIDNLKPFILHIVGENLEGRSLKLYLYNSKAKRIVLEELLPENKFDTLFLIRPIYFDANNSNSANGYTLSVETRSFGKVTSKNLISAIEIYPVELSDFTFEVRNLESDLEILNIKKWGTAIYKVETSGGGVLQLGQGFEPGWLAFQTDYKLLEHVKVNGWSNGWVIPSNQVTNNQITIIFWPQVLQWLGFLILLLTVLVLIVKSKK